MMYTYPSATTLLASALYPSVRANAAAAALLAHAPLSIVWATLSTTFALQLQSLYRLVLSCAPACTQRRDSTNSLPLARWLDQLIAHGTVRIMPGADQSPLFGRTLDLIQQELDINALHIDANNGALCFASLIHNDVTCGDGTCTAYFEARARASARLMRELAATATARHVETSFSSI